MTGTKMLFPAQHLLSSPVFRNLALGSSLNSAGMQGEQVIIGLLVYHLTGSSAWVGLSLALFYAPMLIVGVPAGALADRYNRRSVLIGAELLLSIALFTFAIALFFNTVGLAAALVMSVVSGVLRALHYPAKLSFAGDLSGAGDLVGTLSVLSIVSRIGQLIGAVIAGLVSEYVSPGAAYALLALGHLLAMRCFLSTVVPAVAISKTGAKAPESTWLAIVEYLHLMRRSQLLFLLIVVVSLTEVFGFSFATAMPEIAVERLTVGADGLGIMHAVRNLGGLVGAIVLTLVVVKRLGRLYLGVLMGFGLMLVLLAWASDMNKVLLAVALIAFFASASDILATSMLQLSVPTELRGRAMGAWVVALGMGPVGHLELGLIISLVGTPLALSGNGVVLLLIGVAGWWFLPVLKQIRSD